MRLLPAFLLLSAVTAVVSVAAPSGAASAGGVGVFQLPPPDPASQPPPSGVVPGDGEGFEDAGDVGDIGDVGDVGGGISAPASGDTSAEAVRRPRSREELEQMSREDLFRLAFGRAAPERPRELILTLFVEGRKFGNVDIVYAAGFSSFNFISPRFTAFLDEQILPEERLSAGDSSGYFNSAVLSDAGYLVNVNELMHELHISAPPEVKRLQRTNLHGGYRREPRGEEVSPAFFSFYMNYRLTDRFTHLAYSYDSDYAGFARDDISLRDPAYFDFDGAAAMLGWVLEGWGSVTEPYEGNLFTWDNFQRGDARFVRDIVPWSAKFYLGDVSLSTELSGGGTVGGMRYERNGYFFGNDPNEWRNSVKFFMPRSGWIEFYMDGRYRQRFYLPAGHHQVGGFGGEAGRNSVRLVVRFDDGSIEEIPYEFILSNPRNMPKGETRYAVTAGVRRDAAPAPFCYSYDPRDPALSGDFIYGLSRSVNIGLSAQGSRHAGVAGAQALWSMGGFGFMHLRSSAGYSGQTEAAGWRADANYTADLRRTVKKLNYLLTGGVERSVLPDISLSLRGHYSSARYSEELFNAAPPVNAPAPAAAAGVSGNLGFALFRGSVSADGGASFAGDTLNPGRYYRSEYNYGVRVSQSIKKVSLSASAGESVTREKRSPYFALNTNYAIGLSVKKHSFSASAGLGTHSVYQAERLQRAVYPDSLLADPDFDGPLYDTVPEHYIFDWSGNANMGWRWSTGGSGAGAQTYSANMNMSNLQNVFGRGYTFNPGYSAAAGQYHNRLQLTAGYGLTNQIMSSYDRQSHNINASAAGSFMFADGLWALGRPVSGGFMLIDSRRNLKGANVHVNRSHHSRQDFSRNGWLGAAYLNRVTEYNPAEVTLTLTEAPVGAMLQNNRYYAGGKYKQGYALRLGDEAGVMLQVRFTLSGRPLSYTFATIEPAEGNEAERRSTFTGGDGFLQSAGLRPGKSYRVKFSAQSNAKDVLITIPRDAGAILEMDDIEVEVEGVDLEVDLDVDLGF